MPGHDPLDLRDDCCPPLGGNDGEDTVVEGLQRIACNKCRLRGHLEPIRPGPPHTVTSLGASTMNTGSMVMRLHQYHPRGKLPGVVGDSRVVDQHVQAAEAFLDVLCQQRDVIIGGDVEPHGVQPRPELVRRGEGRFRGAGREQDRVTERGEFAGRSPGRCRGWRR